MLVMCSAPDVRAAYTRTPPHVAIYSFFTSHRRSSSKHTAFVVVARCPFFRREAIDYNTLTLTPMAHTMLLPHCTPKVQHWY